MGLMTAIRNDVKHFMVGCERLLSFALRDGGLTSDEGDIVEFYIRELKTRALPERYVGSHATLTHAKKARVGRS
jgi:hypothetical protein